jgi:thioredoxin reductase
VSHGDLYYVGDVANGLYRQTAIAVGDGILAAMKISRRLEEMDL